MRNVYSIELMEHIIEKETKEGKKKKIMNLSEILWLTPQKIVQYYHTSLDSATNLERVYKNMIFVFPSKMN